MITARFLSALDRFQARRRSRRDRRFARLAFADMQRLDDHILADIGLRRGDVDWGMSLPLEVDAARAVRRRVSRSSQGAGATARSRGTRSARRW